MKRNRKEEIETEGVQSIEEVQEEKPRVGYRSTLKRGMNILIGLEKLNQSARQRNVYDVVVVVDDEFPSPGALFSKARDALKDDGFIVIADEIGNKYEASIGIYFDKSEIYGDGCTKYVKRKT